MLLPSRLPTRKLGALNKVEGQEHEMIAHLSGKLISKAPTASVIECHGVGYEVFHTPFTADKLTSENVSVFIHTNVREDAFQLFGFHTAEERQLFRELLKVSNVGPKMAMSIMSGIPYQELLTALSQKDITRLQKIPGVGKKTGERLVVELADRMAKMPLEIQLKPGAMSSFDKESELESVLMNLGYQRNEILRAVKTLRSRDQNFEAATLETLVKNTLKELSQPRLS